MREIVENPESVNGGKFTGTLQTTEQREENVYERVEDKSTWFYVLNSTGPFLNLDRLLLISLSFFISFTGYSACVNITPKILKDLGYDNLGFLNLSIINFFFAISSLVAAPINKRFGSKNVLFAASLTYPTWIFSFLAPAYKFDNKKAQGFF